MDKTILSRWQEKNFKLYALQLYAQGITSPKVTAKIAALQTEIDAERKKHRGDKLVNFGREILFCRFEKRKTGYSESEEDIWQRYTHNSSITVNRVAGENAWKDYRFAALRVNEALSWAQGFVHSSENETQVKAASRSMPVPHPEILDVSQIGKRPKTEKGVAELLRNRCDDNFDDEEEEEKLLMVEMPSPIPQDFPIKAEVQAKKQTFKEQNLPGFEKFVNIPGVLPVRKAKKQNMPRSPYISHLPGFEQPIQLDLPKVKRIKRVKKVDPRIQEFDFMKQRS